MMKRLFNEHPESVDETYGEHLAQASGFGGRLIAAGLACVIHGLFPFLFKHTGSETVRALNVELSHRRRMARREAREADAAKAAY
ncbi:MAG: DUF6356 family protein [Pseudomonadota bacterium]